MKCKLIIRHTNHILEVKVEGHKYDNKHMLSILSQSYKMMRQLRKMLQIGSNQNGWN
jgi:hypothetical protein